MIKIGRLITIILFCGACCSATCSERILADNALTRYANISISIKDMSTGEIIASHRPNHVVPPASTMKLLTTATALEVFGEDHCFSTFIEYSGSIENGVLYGDIYIKGGGDPLLGNLEDGQNCLNIWTREIHKAGIKTIKGKVIADMSLYDADAINSYWVWGDIGNYYAPGIFSLAYMDNTMNIQLKSGPIGTVAQVIKTVPEVPGVVFENHIRCTEIDYDGAFVHGMPYNNCRYLVGSIPSNLGVFGVKGDIPNPGLLLAQHLTNTLRASNIVVEQEASYIAEANKVHRTLIYENLSLPLKEIVRRTNMYSVNLYAEMLFRNLGCLVSKPSTIHNSEMFIRQFWKNRGVDLSSCVLHDGSGLSPQNVISATTFLQLLTYMKGSENAEAFYLSLPVSGESGTLRTFLDGTPLSGRVHAKSGTIMGTRNYAGYISLPNGKEWEFAILINSANGKSRKIMKVIENYLLDVYQTNQ